MARTHTEPQAYVVASSEMPWWASVMIGAALIAAGLFMLGNVYAATIITVMIIAIPLIIAGVAEIVHAFAAPGWRGFMLSLTIGIFFLIAGIVLFANPVGGAVIVTLILALSLMASGITRVVLAMRLWRNFGWLLLLSGIAAILFGAVILANWPQASLKVLGLLFGLDLLFLGIWWLVYGLDVRRAA